MATCHRTNHDGTHWKGIPFTDLDVTHWLEDPVFIDFLLTLDATQHPDPETTEAVTEAEDT